MIALRMRMMVILVFRYNRCLSECRYLCLLGPSIHWSLLTLLSPCFPCGSCIAAWVEGSSAFFCHLSFKYCITFLLCCWNICCFVVVVWSRYSVQLTHCQQMSKIPQWQVQTCTQTGCQDVVACVAVHPPL